MKFSIVIPCYNEGGERIEQLISRIQPMQEKYDLEYILVENGSRDDSREYFKSQVEGQIANIKVAYVDVNQGYGYGIQQGLKMAEGDYVGWIHADMQIGPEELVPFFDTAIAEGANAILFMKGLRSGRKLGELFFTYGQAAFTTLVFCQKIYDIGAIPVVMHKSLLGDIDVMPNDFSIECYAYVRARQHKAIVKRFRVKYTDGTGRKSTWNRGLKSQIRLSKTLMVDTVKIRMGKKVI